MTKQKSGSLSQTSLYGAIAFLVLAVAFLGFKVTTSNKQMVTLASELQSQKESKRTQCDSSGAPVIDITQKVVNSVDSGEAGNNWAFDSYNRHIQVWKQTNGTYCVLTDYEGKFDAQSGQQSPGNTGLLTGKEDGNFKGGYRAVITGAMKTTPLLKTKGSIGTTDYKCDIAGNCPGAFNWTDKYFDTAAVGYLFDYEWWGWEYRNGTKVWVNASEGNSGDIL